MILLPCPWCGPRAATEFAHIGEVSVRPDPGGTTPSQWRGYLYLRANPCGWTSETWYHRMGCRRFIKVERHTETNEVRLAAPAGVAEVPGTAAGMAEAPGTAAGMAEVPGEPAGARAGGAEIPAGGPNR
jgi:heterotetrameric sarcosine oxidase delta subunit